MSEGQRRDLLGECNADHHPIETFTTECCANCFNPECTRSLAGKSRFDHRVATWFDRYFTDKDRMDPGDSRYPQIAAQRFLFIDPGLTGHAHEVGTGSAWVDPRDLQQPAPVAPREGPDVDPGPPAGVYDVRAEPVAPAAPLPVAPRQVRRDVPAHLLLANAPIQAGQMIKAPPSANSAPAAKDPWAGPTPAPTDDTPVVQPGARVKMGV